MAKQSLEYSLSSLNPSLNSYDLLCENLDRAYALSCVALSDEFFTNEQLVIHSYLSLLSELIFNIRQAFEEAWKEVTNQKNKED